MALIDGTRMQQALTRVKAELDARDATIRNIQNDVSELKQRADSLEIDKADVIVSSASGSIASFPDGADDLPVKSLSVAIEPVQDLHGYDSPWPAGGGKNLLGSKESKTINVLPAGSSFTFEKDSSQITFIASGLSTSLEFRFKDIDLECTLPAGTYYFSSNISNQMSGSGLFVFNADTSAILARARLEEGGQFTLSEAATIRLGASLSTTTVSGTYWFQLESGSTATAYEPYSNICPISGFEGLTVTRTGKNLLNNNSATTTISGVTFTVNDDGTVSTTGTASSSSPAVFRIWRTIDVTSDIILSGCPTGGNYAVGYSMMCCDLNGQNVVPQSGIDIGSGATFPAEVIPNIRQIQIIIRPGVNANGLVFKPMIRLASISDATYAPCTEQVYSIALPSEAGTVYGGELTVNDDGTGELAVDRVSVDMGTLGWSQSNTEARIYKCAPPNMKSVIEPPYENRKIGAICSIYPASAYTAISDRMADKAWLRYSTQFFVRDMAYDSVASFKTAMSGVQLVYELATPVSYTLTAIEVLETLKGVNNIWADTGNTSVSYRADTKLYIDNKITQAIAAALNA